jgi:hypothetical protein
MAMSIRLIAQELYRLQKEVERLENELARAPRERQADIQEKLRVVRAERKRMRDVLDGQKDRSR